VHQESSSNDVWILGAGPFQRGTIHSGTEFAGKAIRSDQSQDEMSPKRLPPVDLARESLFTPPEQLAQQQKSPAEAEPGAIQAAHEETVPPADGATPAAEPDTAPPLAETPNSHAAPAPAPGSIYTPSTAKLPQPRFDSR
jgi:hypothetical protein